jgi:hypothetical protein
MKKFLYYSKKNVKVIFYKNKPSFEILDIKEIDIDGLSHFIDEKDLVGISFESDLLYIDTIDFINPSKNNRLSKITTNIAIRNAVNESGMFVENFEISFKKLRQSNKEKTTYYYVAVNESNLIYLDNLKCTIEQCVPTEIAVKNLFCANLHDNLPALVIIEKQQYIRAFSFSKDRLFEVKNISKDVFNAKFDEFIQFIQDNLDKYKIENVYFLGSRETQDVLANIGIKTIIPNIQIGKLSQEQILDYIEVLGLLYKSDIGFLTSEQQDNYLLFKHSKNAVKLAGIVFIVGLFVMFAGFINYFKDLSLTNELNQNMANFQQVVGSVNTNIDTKDIQNNIDTYLKISKTPKISHILADLSTYKMPNLYFTEVDFRYGKNVKKQKQDETNLPPIDNRLSGEKIPNSNPSGDLPSYSINIEGIIFGSLNDTKDEFNEFLKEISTRYNVVSSDFHYLGDKSSFTVSLEVRSVSF